MVGKDGLGSNKSKKIGLSDASDKNSWEFLKSAVVEGKRATKGRSDRVQRIKEVATNWTNKPTLFLLPERGQREERSEGKSKGATNGGQGLRNKGWQPVQRKQRDWEREDKGKWKAANYLEPICFYCICPNCNGSTFFARPIMQLFVGLYLAAAEEGGKTIKCPNRIPRCNCYLRGEKTQTDFGRSAFISARTDCEI